MKFGHRVYRFTLTGLMCILLAACSGDGNNLYEGVPGATSLDDPNNAEDLADGNNSSTGS